jgi:hypothetical protein
MLVVSVPTQTILPHVVSTARDLGYAGLLFILARTAEASELHDELTRHWTSIHDVTGQSIAVVCPNPLNLRAVYDLEDYYGTDPHIDPTERDHPPLAIHNLQIASPRGFEDGLQYSAGRAGALREFHAVPPAIPELHHAAWTEAVSRCAEYFGIGESELPAILVLGLKEKEAVLLRTDSQFSIYDFCKAIAVEMRCGETPSALLAEISRLAAEKRLKDPQIEERLRAAQQRLEELRHRPQDGFVDVCERAAGSVGAYTSLTPAIGRAALKGYRLRVLRQAGSGSPPGRAEAREPTTTRNDIRGPVSGNTVQAHVIHGGVHFHSRAANRRLRRWIRRALPGDR